MATFQPINPLDFFKELFIRLTKTSPKFFRILQYVSLVAALITGLPLALNALHASLPAAWEAVSSKAGVIASAVGLFISSLPVDNAPKVAVAEPTQLPVTAKDENNKIAAKN